MLLEDFRKMVEDGETQETEEAYMKRILSLRADETSTHNDFIKDSEHSSISSSGSSEESIKLNKTSM